MVAKTATTPKNNEKDTHPINYRVSKEARAILDDVKKTPKVKLEDFVSEAIIFYAQECGYTSPRNKLPVEKRLELLERYVFKEKFDEARTTLSDEELKKAQEILAKAPSVPMNSKQSRPLNDELGKELHWSVWYSLHLAPFHGGKIKHISTESAENQK